MASSSTTFKSSIGYDFDGVLCESLDLAAHGFTKSFFKMSGPERKARQEFMMEWYKNTKQLYVPEEKEFHIITARKMNTMKISVDWLQKWTLEHRKGFMVSFLDRARTYDNVAAFKAQKIKELGIIEFTEDNQNILNRLKKLVPECKLWFFDGKERHPYG